MSCNARHITHTSCRFGLAIWPHQCRSDDSDQMRQHKTAIGRHSDNRIVRTRQMDTLNIMTHTTTQKHFVIFFSSCDSLVFQHEQTCRGSCRCTWKRRTKASSARKFSDENADTNYHAALPPKHQARCDSKRENLCQPYFAWINKTAPGASSSGQQETGGGHITLLGTSCNRRFVKWKES